MSTTHELGLTGPEPVASGTAPLGKGYAEDARFATLSHGSDASGAFAELRMTQVQALQQRFRNDLQSMCGLASWHGSRADGIASEAGFKAIGRRAMALAALYDDLLCNAGVGSVGIASYLGRLCARLASAECPGRALILLAEGCEATPGAADSMDGDAASALGTAVAELVAAVAGYGMGDLTVQMLLPDKCGRRRLTVSTTAGPDDTAGPQFSRRHDLVLAKALIAQSGGELDRFVSSSGAGWCVRF
ncbi:MAG: histidine kinase dimerization/phosphoacceptor domain -containing protein [Janthinobacterium lividum]